MATLFASPSLIADLIVNGLLIGGLYAIIAMGLNLQYGMLRILNIAHGEFLMIGAFITYTLTVATGASPLWFLPVSAAAMFALGLLLHVTVFRRLSAISANLDIMEERSLIVGFGLMFILQNAAVLIWGADLHGYDFITNSIHIGGVIFTANRLVVLVLAVLVSAGFDSRPSLDADRPRHSRPWCRRRSAPCWSASTPQRCIRSVSRWGWRSRDLQVRCCR